MAKLIHLMNMSLDDYTEDEHGRLLRARRPNPGQIQICPRRDFVHHSSTP